jgi:8-oxo-dGTP pyrophosphatase MutT (NUDIX family)
MKIDEILVGLSRRVSNGDLNPEAMLQMAPIGRTLPKKDWIEKQNPKRSAVLIPIFMSGGEYRTVLIRRKSYRGVHSGQISFAGGRQEEEELPHQTAMREAEEEVGLKPAEVELTGKLSGLYIPPSNFWVEPFVARLTKAPKLIPEPSEVEYILTPAISQLLSPDIRTETVVQTRAGQMKVPAFDLDGEIIWGATAMILSEFIDLCGHR